MMIPPPVRPPPRVVLPPVRPPPREEPHMDVDYECDWVESNHALEHDAETANDWDAWVQANMPPEHDRDDRDRDDWDDWDDWVIANQDLESVVPEKPNQPLLFLPQNPGLESPDLGVPWIQNNSHPHDIEMS